MAQPQGYGFWIVGDERAMLRDAYHTFLRASWKTTTLGFVIAFMALNLVFAAAYEATGGVDGVKSLWDVLVFSVTTFGTIGYGVMVPKSVGANSVMIVESIASVMFTALATGLLFAKFSRPTARVAFTSVAVLTKHEGQDTLMFRIGNRRSNVIVEATLRVTAGMTTKTKEGETFYKLHDLKLVRDRMGGMRRGWVVMHEIDATSPFRGLDADGLARAEVEIEVSMVGYDDVTMQTVYASHIYTDKQIKPGFRFADTIKALPDGDLVVDLRQFDAIVPDTQSRDSVAA